ncbi:MAG: helix-turn-helix domain-containing protein [Thermoplasmatales archaeon]|jgi:DNA-binding HxlR family transcriptional regulator|nr:helix-turn-helix transcriptional regulator [Candidatus Thermoplasmatota archaeon]MDA8056066.1 helix-turn-helix domain-containing protein [Thermoplasmatales archaeon]
MGSNEDMRFKNKNKACMIEYMGTTVCIDPSLPFLDLVGKKYTMMILGVIGNKGSRKNFNEIVRDIPFSSTTIISRRLKELLNFGLIRRDEGKLGVSYSLTDFGKNVRESLMPFFRIVENAKQD